jgi:plastocyanin
MDRRRFLGWGASALVTGLAGCGGGDGSLVPSRTDTSGSTATGATRDTAGSAAVVVKMTDDLAFRPETVEITAGETVTWTNVGTYPHTVTAYADGIPDGGEYFASGGFESERAARVESGGYVEEGDSYSHAFETAGVYEYYCIPHEYAGMVGTVEVLPG